MAVNPKTRMPAHQLPRRSCLVVSLSCRKPNFNLIYMFPVDGSELKALSSTHRLPRRIVQLFHQSCRFYTQKDWHVLGDSDTLLGDSDTLLGDNDTLLGDNDTLLGDTDTLLGDNDTLLGYSIVVWFGVVWWWLVWAKIMIAKLRLHRSI